VVGLNFKKKVMLLLIITWLLSLTGCWDHLEVERLGIIGIIALDQAPWLKSWCLYYTRLL
jgi:hypothetical protein